MFEDRKISSTGTRTHTVWGHHPFVLDEPGVMWVVRTGSAAVFAARIEDGAPVGERRFVGRVGSGESLLGLGAAGSSIQLIALAIEDLTLVEHPLNGLPADGLVDEAPLSERLEDWVDRLSTFLGADSGSAEIERITEPAPTGTLSSGSARKQAGPSCSAQSIWNFVAAPRCRSPQVRGSRRRRPQR